MSINKKLAIIVLVFSFAIGLLGVRIFPFSDYPMFAYVRTHLEAYTIMIKNKDGTEVLMRAHHFYPFYRLHIHQMVMFTLDKPNPDFSWLKLFERRAKRQVPDAVALTITRVAFKRDKNRMLDMSSPSIILRVHEMPL